jgi:hypothetical protein
MTDIVLHIQFMVFGFVKNEKSTIGLKVQNEKSTLAYSEKKVSLQLEED